MVTPFVRFRWLHLTEDYDLQGINDFNFAAAARIRDQERAKRDAAQEQR